MKYTIIFLVVLITSCSTTNNKSEMTLQEELHFISNVAINPRVSASTQYDEKGCIISPEKYTFDDIIFDIKNKRFYLPGGIELSQMEALSLIPGMAICNN